ncbi:MAG TPA: hypothetical protein VHC69_22595 [Polyangiaceae bacterium]|nr:hypothetical protein [Polyangiaceae bacterium]
MTNKFYGWATLGVVLLGIPGLAYAGDCSSLVSYDATAHCISNGTEVAKSEGDSNDPGAMCVEQYVGALSLHDLGTNDSGSIICDNGDAGDTPGDGASTCTEVCKIYADSMTKHKLTLE